MTGEMYSEHSNIVDDHQICLLITGNFQPVDKGAEAALEDRVEPEFIKFGLEHKKLMQSPAGNICLLWTFSDDPGAMAAQAHVPEVRYLLDSIFPSSSFEILTWGKSLPLEFQSE